jgi:hypothetical protein
MVDASTSVPDSARPMAAQRDSLDFRDLIYRPALVQLKQELLPNKEFIHVLDQGLEGACTGFGLAAVINHLLCFQGRPSSERVSPRMLYEMAKRHDQWPEQDYEGSSARGAMKGWHKNGVCSESAWPYDPNDVGYLTRERQDDALKCPLGAYYRILRHRSDLHAALNEVGAVFATAMTHTGWTNVQNGVIPFGPGQTDKGGHAFAIIGYTQQGLIVQNSWGESWGGITINGITYPGCALWQYADFDQNLWDAWVARLALPLESMEALAATTTRYVERPGGTAVTDLAPPRPTIREHYVHIDDGRFDDSGDYYSDPEEVRAIIKEVLQAPPKHLLFYAHGGLTSVPSAAARIGKWRPVFKGNGIHEIHFIWETGFLEELGDLLRSKLGLAEQRAAGVSDWWDKILERLTQWPGSALWKEMQSGAETAFKPEKAGDRFIAWLLETLNRLPAADRPQLHLVGHSAGSIWLGHLLQSWKRHQGPPIANMFLFAPACTHDFFASQIRPAISSSAVHQLYHFLLDDESEQADSVHGIYQKSLLYLVSRSFQSKQGVVPLMGMETYLNHLPTANLGARLKTYITAESLEVTASTTHGGFDDDEKTMNSVLRLVLGEEPSRPFSGTDLQGY